MGTPAVFVILVIAGVGLHAILYIRGGHSGSIAGVLVNWKKAEMGMRVASLP